VEERIKKQRNTKQITGINGKTKSRENGINRAQRTKRRRGEEAA
jgi:hypothetical protein